MHGTLVNAWGAGETASDAISDEVASLSYTDRRRKINRRGVTMS